MSLSVCLSVCLCVSISSPLPVHECMVAHRAQRGAMCYTGDEPVVCYSRPPFTSTVCTHVFLLTETLDTERSFFWEKARVWRDHAGWTQPAKAFLSVSYTVNPGHNLSDRWVCKDRQWVTSRGLCHHHHGPTGHISPSPVTQEQPRADAV